MSKEVEIVETPANAQEAEVTEMVKGKASFGLAQIYNPTPLWVIWTFRVQFVLNKLITIWFTTTTLIPTANIKEIVLALTLVDSAVWGLGKFIGISKDTIDK